MCNEKQPERCNNCIADILDVILKLQRRGQQQEELADGCDKPFLGPCPSICCYNTRPITFFRCCDGGQWTMPYTLNSTEGTSNVFRVENLDDCCCTCRVLAKDGDSYVATDSFFTINLDCVGAIKCLEDTYVACL